MKKTTFIVVLTAVAIVLFNCGDNKCDDCEALGITMPIFEKQFPQKTIRLNKDYVITEKSFKINYSSMSVIKNII